MGITDVVFGKSKLKRDLYNSRQEIIVLRQDVQRLENQIKISEGKRSTAEVRNEYLVDVVKDALRNLVNITSKMENTIVSLEIKQDEKKEKKEEVSVLPPSMRSMRPLLKEELDPGSVGQPRDGDPRAHRQVRMAQRDQAENRLKRVH